MLKTIIRKLERKKKRKRKKDKTKQNVEAFQAFFFFKLKGSHKTLKLN